MSRLGRGVPALLLVSLVGCSADPTASAEYRSLDGEYEQLEEELAAANSELQRLEVTNAKLRASGMFRFAEDDLCAWVSEDDVATFVRDAYARDGIEWDGQARAAEPSGSAWELDGPYCRWEPTGGGHVIARHLPLDSVNETPREFSGYGEFGVFTGHPDLPDGVLMANEAFGRYAFWVDGSDEVLGIELDLPGIVEDGQPDSEQYERALVVVANDLLADMGWTRWSDVLG